jgi:hypothetical protein
MNDTIPQLIFFFLFPTMRALKRLFFSDVKDVLWSQEERTDIDLMVLRQLGIWVAQQRDWFVVLFSGNCAFVISFLY